MLVGVVVVLIARQLPAGAACEARRAAVEPHRVAEVRIARQERLCEPVDRRRPRRGSERLDAATDGQQPHGPGVRSQQRPGPVRGRLQVKAAQAAHASRASSSPIEDERIAEELVKQHPNSDRLSYDERGRAPTRRLRKSRPVPGQEEVLTEAAPAVPITDHPRSRASRITARGRVTKLCNGVAMSHSAPRRRSPNRRGPMLRRPRQRFKSLCLGCGLRPTPPRPGVAPCSLCRRARVALRGRRALESRRRVTSFVSITSVGLMGRVTGRPSPGPAVLPAARADPRGPAGRRLHRLRG